MAASPILPRNNADVTGQQRRVKGSINEFARRMRKVRSGMLKILADQQYQVITLNSFGINATTYQFLLDDSVLSRIDLEIAYLIDELMDEGTPQTNWFVKGYAEPAYVNGLAMTHANLSVQSASYAASRPTLESVLMSPAYKSRIGLLRARVFNEMKGLSDTMKGDLSATLSRGMAAGQNPRKIAKDIEQRVGVSTSRANRIAQTEIVGAMRTARLEEAQQAQTELGIMSKMMHLSAISPTTRPSHLARHAHIYTIQESKDWWSIKPNMINCYLPGTKVAGRFKAGSKSHYRGPVVKVVTASGRNFTVTSNHPVMTSLGMLPAAEINKGDYLLAYDLKIEDPVGVSALDVYQTHPVIEDVFGSISKVGHSFSARVGAVDFHGDGAFMDEDISVVLADSVLTFACDAKLSESLDNLSLKHSDSRLAHANGSLFENLKTVLLPSSFFVGVLGHAKSFFSGALGVSNSRSLFHPSVFKPESLKPSVEGNSGGSALLANLKDGLSFDMLPVQIRKIKAVCQTWRADTAILKPSPHSPAANSSDNRKLLESLPSLISLDKVVEVSVAYFSGHVYDLEEVSGLMVAEGLIMSNCKCSTVEVLVDEKGNPLSPGIIERAKRKLG